MKRKFLEYFPFVSPIAIDQLWQIATILKCENKEIVILTGQRANALFFILQGMVRGYYIDENGEERTVFLRPEGTFFASPEVLHNQQLSRFTFETIQECIIIRFPFSEFENLALHHSSLAQLYISSLKENVLTLVFRVEMLAGKTPEERYNILLKQYPQMFQHAYHKHIANYLGMTPNSLSRIIKRKKEERS